MTPTQVINAAQFCKCPSCEAIVVNGYKIVSEAPEPTITNPVPVNSTWSDIPIPTWNGRLDTTFQHDAPCEYVDCPHGACLKGTNGILIRDNKREVAKGKKRNWVWHFDCYERDPRAAEIRRHRKGV